MLMNVISSGLVGMQQSQHAMRNAATDIAAMANVGGTGGARPTQEVSGLGVENHGIEGAVEGIVEPLIRIQQSHQMFDASAKLVDVGRQNIGTLLNISA
jgi:hypothetical protein